MRTTLVLRVVAIGGLGCICVAGNRGAVPLAAQAPAAPAKSQPARPSSKEPATLGIRRPATPAEIAALDIDVGPDGAGLPPDAAPPPRARRSTRRAARLPWEDREEGPNDVWSAACRATRFPFARAIRERRDHRRLLAGYATTVFDYVRRAMPPTRPGRCGTNEVYGLVACPAFPERADSSGRRHRRLVSAQSDNARARSLHCPTRVDGRSAVGVLVSAFRRTVVLSG